MVARRKREKKRKWLAAAICFALCFLLLRFIWGGRSSVVDASVVAAMRAPMREVFLLKDCAAQYGLDFAAVLSAYMFDNRFFTDGAVALSDTALADAYAANHSRLRSKLGEDTLVPYDALFRVLSEEIEYFPVASAHDSYMYGDSFKGDAYTRIVIFARERAPDNLRVVAMARGIVWEIGKNTKDGQYVVIKTVNQTIYIYTHLARVSATVTAGETIAAGAPIGIMGDTGANGRNELFPVRLAVGVQVTLPLFAAPAWVNPYIFMRLVENVP